MHKYCRNEFEKFKVHIISSFTYFRISNVLSCIIVTNLLVDSQRKTSQFMLNPYLQMHISSILSCIMVTNLHANSQRNTSQFMMSLEIIYISNMLLYISITNLYINNRRKTSQFMFSPYTHYQISYCTL